MSDTRPPPNSTASPTHSRTPSTASSHKLSSIPYPDPHSTRPASPVASHLARSSSAASGPAVLQRALPSSLAAHFNDGRRPSAFGPAHGHMRSVSGGGEPVPRPMPALPPLGELGRRPSRELSGLGASGARRAPPLPTTRSVDQDLTQAFLVSPNAPAASPAGPSRLAPVAVAPNSPTPSSSGASISESASTVIIQQAARESIEPPTRAQSVVVRANSVSSPAAHSLATLGSATASVAASPYASPSHAHLARAVPSPGRSPSQPNSPDTARQSQTPVLSASRSAAVPTTPQPSMASSSRRVEAQLPGAFLPPSLAHPPATGMYWTKAPVGGRAMKGVRAHSSVVVGEGERDKAVWFFGGCDAVGKCNRDVSKLDCGEPHSSVGAVARLDS